MGNLFNADTYGFIRQQEVLTYSATSSVPTFTCSYLVQGFELLDESLSNYNQRLIRGYCLCMDEISVAQVTLLWMSTSTAIKVIALIQQLCHSAKKWTFLVTDDVQISLDYTSVSQRVLKNVLLLRNNGPWNLKGFIDECQANASPTALTAIDNLVPEYYRLAYNCEIDPQEVLEKCPSSLLDRTTVCKCEGNEIANDPYTVLADGIKTHLFTLF